MGCGPALLALPNWYEYLMVPVLLPRSLCVRKALPRPEKKMRTYTTDSVNGLGNHHLTIAGGKLASCIFRHLSHVAACVIGPSL